AHRGAQRVHHLPIAPAGPRECRRAPGPLGSGSDGQPRRSHRCAGPHLLARRARAGLRARERIAEMNGRFSRLEVESKPAVAAEQLAEPALLGNTIRTSQTDMQAADEALRNGRFEHALQMYTKALGKNQSLVAAWVGQVQMLVELGEYAEARLWS